MQLKLNYKEVTDYVKNHFHIEPEISHTDAKNIIVSYSPNRFFPSIKAAITVEEVNEFVTVLHYDMAPAAMKLFNGLLPMFESKLDKNIFSLRKDEQRLVININGIKGIEKVTEYLTLSDITFDETALYINARLK